jgi:uncharacterized repeat protein (TIGR04138 family)
MQKLSFQETLDQIVAEDRRYDREAYVFVREALDHTIKTLKKDRTRSEARHVSGQELLEGIRQHALKEYGPMAITVLGSWGVLNCENFGDIVFNLVEKGVLGKTDQDRREDFQHGYDFQEAFVAPFRPSLPARVKTSLTRQLKPAPDARRPAKKSIL